MDIEFKLAKQQRIAPLYESMKCYIDRQTTEYVQLMWDRLKSQQAESLDELRRDLAALQLQVAEFGSEAHRAKRIADLEAEVARLRQRAVDREFNT